MSYSTPTRKIYLRKLREKYVGKFFEEYVGGIVKDVLVLKDVRKVYRDQLHFIFYSVKNNEDKIKCYSKNIFHRQYYEHFYDYGIWGYKEYSCICLMKS